MLVIFPLVPHHEAVSLVQLYGSRVKLRAMLLQLPEELDRELLTSLAGADPHTLEVSVVADILGYCDGEVQVKDRVPPVAGHEHRLTRVLNALNPVWNHPASARSFLLLQPGKNKVEVLDCLIVFALLH